MGLKGQKVQVLIYIKPIQPPDYSLYLYIPDCISKAGAPGQAPQLMKEINYGGKERNKF